MGRQPQLRTKSRQYVDAGSDVYVDFMGKVPILPERDHLKVDLATKDEILPTLIAEDAGGDEGDMEDGDGDDADQPKRSYSKRFSGRALFRTVSNPENTVFPGVFGPRL